jgi:hypothetical protein
MTSKASFKSHIRPLPNGQQPFESFAKKLAVFDNTLCPAQLRHPRLHLYHIQADDIGRQLGH